MAKFNSPLKKIAVYSSGGDAPGMNAAIRATVRIAIQNNIETVGIIGGYAGILENKINPLTLRDMANIIQRGGTILKTGRCLEFLKPEYRKKAADILRSHNIDAMVCIGGDGSFTGAQLLWKEHQIPIIGVPGTIDNDIYGTDNTIGFDTAVNTAVECIDKIRDTAASHDRLFIVEVMGRNSGFIASHVGLAGGAEEIFVPENVFSLEKVIEKIKLGMAKGKGSSILIAAEGQKPGRAYDLAEQIRKKTGFDAKVCILGHLQRGGSPSAVDRVLASRLGAAAISVLMRQECDVMVGEQNGKVVTVPLEEAVNKEKTLDQEYIHLSAALSV
jgi:6-phosphofructokinase 1